jgi:hypothetical protein
LCFFSGIDKFLRASEQRANSRSDWFTAHENGGQR